MQTYNERLPTILLNLGAFAIDRGDYKQAEEYLQEGLTLANKSENRWYISANLYKWGMLNLKQKKLRSASTFFLKSMKVARDANHTEQIATALFGLAQLAAAQGNGTLARRRGQESLDIFKDIGHYMAAKVKQWMDSL